MMAGLMKKKTISADHVEVGEAEQRVSKAQQVQDAATAEYDARCAAYDRALRNPANTADVNAAFGARAIAEDRLRIARDALAAAGADLQAARDRAEQEWRAEHRRQFDALVRQEALDAINAMADHFVGILKLIQRFDELETECHALAVKAGLPWALGTSFENIARGRGLSPVDRRVLGLEITLPSLIVGEDPIWRRADGMEDRAKNVAYALELLEKQRRLAVQEITKASPASAQLPRRETYQD